ncbi:capsular polysaccharide transport system permease protein [Sulfitobacter undariae]|uniref:Capsular polysaccharide transport system permease protein n=1 Tax=Sulfitobacter undariae TaxID=1563671 RepID=A0A7W6E703_9RHOB|nr:sugar transporter [Sulfitobacter undariae]MBB3995905.1 capsular polysaccharide transport system permease protein [Sulfitobacter undariae]
MNETPPKDISAAPQTQATQSATATQPTPAVPKPRKAVKAARFQRRHFGLLVSFGAIVVMPVLVVAVYMWAIADDQYSSQAGFTIRKEEGSGASELLGGLASLGVSSGGSDGDILYEFILSQALIQDIDDNVGLREHYGARWSSDPVFGLKPDAKIEDLERYWSRVVRLSYDRSSGLVDLRVLAFTPEKAQEIATEMIRLSQNMINALNDQAREDAMRYARSDLAEAVERLKAVREDLTRFRSYNQIVNPDADIQGRMGVMNNLQQQLAQSLINLDLLTGSTNDSDPRLRQAERLIEVIQERIAAERQKLSSGGAAAGGTGEDYPRLIAEYEALIVDREFTERNYSAALSALDLARANASRQSRYLATYIAPTLAQTSEYPRRGAITGLVGVFLLLSWSVMALVYYSIRDRS